MVRVAGSPFPHPDLWARLSEPHRLRGHGDTRRVSAETTLLQTGAELVARGPQELLTPELDDRSTQWQN